MLSLETPKSVFDHFLRETYGIEKNDFDCVDAAKAAKASGSIWGDFCTAWRKTPEEGGATERASRCKFAHGVRACCAGLLW